MLSDQYKLNQNSSRLCELSKCDRRADSKTNYRQNVKHLWTKVGRLVLPDIKTAMVDKPWQGYRNWQVRPVEQNGELRRYVWVWRATWWRTGLKPKQTFCESCHGGLTDESVSGGDACCQVQVWHPALDPQAHTGKREPILKVGLRLTPACSVIYPHCARRHAHTHAHTHKHTYTQCWGKWLAICEK